MKLKANKKSKKKRREKPLVRLRFADPRDDRIGSYEDSGEEIYLQPSEKKNIPKITKPKEREGIIDN